MPPLYDGAPPGSVRSRVAGAGSVRPVRNPELYSRAQAPMSEGRSLAERLDDIERARTADSYSSSSAGARYRQNMPQQHDNVPRRYFHVTEVPEGRAPLEHARSFREKGILGSERTSFGAGRQVFAHPNPPETLGPNQQYVAFEEARRPSGRGTSFMGRGPASTAVSFADDVPAPRVRGVFGHLPEGGIGQIADAGSRTVGLMALLGTAAQFIPGFAERMPRTSWLANGGPIGDVLNSVIASNYGQGGIMDPYRDYQGPRGPNGAILA